MKRIIAAVLILALALPLAACGGGESSLAPETETGTLIRATGETKTKGGDGAHNATGFCAGVARADITPKASVPLAGYGNTSLRLSQNVLDPLYCTCLALRDAQGNTLLIYHLDIINIWNDVGEKARNMVMKAVNVPYENVLINATHTHSAPDGGLDNSDISVWKGELLRAITSTAKAAVADLDACTLYVGATQTDRLNFVRRYYKENGFTCDNADYGTGEITGHETPVDEEMRILRFDRENQPDVVVANWQCHPHRTGGSTKTDISSDIIGVMREKAEKKLGVKFLYLQGGGGNINPVSRISGEARFTDYKDIGNALYEHLAQGLDNLTETPAGTIRAASCVMPGKVDHTLDYLVPQAQEAAALYATNDRAGGNALAVAAGLSSAFEASAVVWRSKQGETIDIELFCYAIGDVAITAAPFEMFCQTEKQLREDSPFSFTLTCGYSNSRHGYMPAAECWVNKGYEVVTCRYTQGTAEEINARQLEMLNELKAK